MAEESEQDKELGVDETGADFQRVFKAVVKAAK
jgi:hypothetical protein